MTLAWFRPGPVKGDPSDDTALLINALRARHLIDVVDADRAHDFVWMHARRPYDAVVYELDDTPAHRFIWPYLVHYPGITHLRRLSLRNSRDDAFRAGYRGAWDLVRVALAASRAVVVPHAATAEALSADHQGANIRHITPGVEPPANPKSQIPNPNEIQKHKSQAQTPDPNDVVVALPWPVAGNPLTEALAGFAAGQAVVVFDTLETAEWPSLDPQTWKPRGAVATTEVVALRERAEPICVSIDPRDEAHSLRLAMRRLSGDAELRTRLGAAAQAWWRANATVEIAAAGFEAVLADVAALAPPREPADWPAPLTDDGTRLAREIVSGLGVEVDFLVGR